MTGVTAGFCFNSGYGFALPTFAPHEATTCHVRRTSLEASTTPLSYPIQLITWLMRDAATGGNVIASSGTLRFLTIDLDAIFRDRFEQRRLIENPLSRRGGSHHPGS